MDVRKYRDGREATTSAWDKNGERLGFASRDKDALGYTRYGVGLDKMGSPYRGVLDRELATALGNLDYGYDGDTVYAGFTPNVYNGENEYAKWGGIGTLNGNRVGYYKNADGKSDYFANLGDYTARAGVRPNDNGANSYYGLLALPDSARSFNAEGSLNTPLGELSYSPVEDAPGMYASFTPNNYYIQALKNLLGR
jgi:hypothetical protein